MKLVLFDFDGTLTNKDSFIEFVRFSHSNLDLFKSVLPLAIPLAISKLQSKDGGQIKEVLVKKLYGGMNEGELRNLGIAFSKDVIPNIINQEILNQLLSSQENGDHICIVSASLDLWLKPWCESMGLNFICTELEFTDEKCTGLFATPNCNFEEKALRIKSKFDLSKYNEIIAYGNSKGDQAMFDLATSYHKI